MPDNFISQSSPDVSVVILAPIVKTDSDLIYTLGGGTYFGTTLKEDSVDGGKQLHGGNPVLTADETPIFRKEDKVTVTTDVIKIEGPSVTRGILLQAYNTDPTGLTDAQKLERQYTDYFWDEVYTSPLGYYTVISSGSGLFAFSISLNTITIQTNDVNIVPKVGDFLVMQKVPAGYDKGDLSDMGSGSSTDYSGIFTDGFSNLRIIQNTETYQFKIAGVAFSAPSGISTEYTLTLDKSINLTDGDEYSIVLLNRENTGLQKELFYDTFEQIEVHREQLLGDPYFNQSATKPLGKKNFLYYNNAQYLGLRNLLTGIIKTNNQNFMDTPFMVFDIDEDIKDRFLPTAATVEFHLPVVTLQDDTNDNLNVLTNFGLPITDTAGVGQYSQLYMKWDTAFNKPYGFVFFDLRIIVIDDPELVLALAYNSNRNYTMPKPIVSNGNKLQNRISTLNLNVISIVQRTGEPAIIVVDGNHNLKDLDSVSIEGVKVKYSGSNLIKSSTVNGIRYIRRVYTDKVNLTGEQLDRFYIYSDSAGALSVTETGQFYSSGVGQSGKVKGSNLEYNYFMTYRFKSDRYSSILPYAELTNFNFVTSANAPEIDNTGGRLYLTLPKLTHINHAYTVNDIEIIVGKWDTGNIDKPSEITGYSNVVVMSYKGIAGPGSNPPASLDLDLVLSKTDYDTAVGKMGNGNGPYDYTTNVNGDPTYDIYNNFKHYNMATVSFPTTLNTAGGKWTIGNIKYKTQVEQYRSNIQIVVGASEWNDTTNPSYDPANTFITEKYISEVAIVANGDTTNKPLVYAKIAPPVKKTSDLDLILNLSIDF
jgi:hypothetical protein